MFTSVLFTLALLGQAAGPMPPADADLAPQVTRLVRQLDDEALARREAAETALIALGHRALDLLPEASPTLSAETRERLARVRRQLELKLAETAAQPTRVTLAGEMPLSKVLEAITAQTGNKIVDYRPEFNQRTADPLLKVEFRDTPFWEAVDQVFDDAGLTLYHYSGHDQALAIVARAIDEELPRRGHAAYAGRFRFDALTVTANRDLRNPSGHSLRVALETTWEPTLRPIVLLAPLDQLSATSEDGEPLPLAGRGGALEIGVIGNTSATEFDVNLQLPPRQVRKIASLKGKMTAIVPGKVETFTFANITTLKNAAQRRGGVAVVVEEVRKNADVHELRMRVEFDKAANALESHRPWVFDNPAMLVAPDGTEHSHEGLEETRRESNVAGVSYKFILDEEPVGYKFVYQTPASIMKLPVEFELKDIELP